MPTQTRDSTDTCTVCKGTGKQTITAKTWVNEAHKFVDEKPVTIDCIWCKGTGRMTPEQKADIKAYDAMWCRCKKSSGSTYHPDTRRMKHHWTCNDCGKVTQVG